MEETVLGALKCSNSQYSNHIIEQPRSLSCGHFICKDCMPVSDKDIIICWHCYKTNRIPLANLKSFPENATAKFLFLQSLDSIFNDLQKKFKKEIVYLKELESDNLDYPFEVLKEHICKRMEAFKSELDTLKDQLIKRLEKFRLSLKYKLEDQLKRFDRKFYEHKYRDLKGISQNEENFFDFQHHFRKLEEFNCEIRAMKSSVKFVPSNFSLTLNQIGRFEGLHAPFQSRILNEHDVLDLIDLCEFNPCFKWKLLYRASVDGFRAKDFHRTCDDFIDTLVIIKTNTNEILGGYTSLPWGSIKPEENSIFRREFIFSFEILNCKKFKIDCRDNQLPKKYRNIHTGPTFCSDIHISDNCDENFHSFHNFGHSYTFNTTQSQSNFYFKVYEIEIFKLYI